MDNEAEVILERMEETRTSLQDKLETLEQQVTETVQHATETVQHATATVSETVDNVKGAVHETVESVKDSLDLRHQVECHPWAMVLGAALTGYVAGRLLDRPKLAPAAPALPICEPPAAPARNGITTAANGVQGGAHSAPARTLWNTLSDEYRDELQLVKGLAVSTLAGVVREMLTASAPSPLASQIKQIVDGVTVKLGGHPLEGPILNLPPRTEEAQEQPVRGTKPLQAELVADELPRFAGGLE
jgi:ElaB/YqjD/DUF883 family membrane-anchored ribosome-binding protein